MAALLAACGGSTPDPETAENEEDPMLAAFAREREALEAERPEEPLVDGRTRAFELPAGCGQGPYRVRVEAIGSNHRERVRVYACSSREITGTYRLHVEPWSDQTYAFGHEDFVGSENRARCAATATERASAGGSGGGARDAEGSTASSSGGAATSEPAAEPAALEPIEGDASEECGDGRFRVHIADSGYTNLSPGPVIPPGAPIEIVFWSELPNDLTGVTLIVDQDVTRPGLTAEEWRAYYDAEQAWNDRYRALLDREVAAGAARILDTSPHAAEPPPPPRAEDRPPRPSDRARWIAGYWHHDTSWIWIAGFWRVPQIDVDEERTVRAPTPPPAPRTETSGAKPATDAVWAPGYWQWDGAAYVWVAGAWRIPPTAHHTWRPDAWLSRGSVTIFAPGGWTIRP